jgi:hypothetical protein
MIRLREKTQNGGKNTMKSEMAIVDGTGDTKLIWDAENADEVENAKETFDRLKKKGYMAFEVTGKDGEKGKVMKTFNPKAERVIITPALEAG